MRIAIDIDGVLANWNAAFARKIGARLPPEGPEHWNWPERFAAESPARAALVNREFAMSDETFWDELDPLEEDLDLRALTRDHQVFFITKRPAEPWMQELTAEWLYDYYNLQFPTVIVTQGAKQPILDALGVEVALDDYWGNLRTGDVLRTAPYNRHINWDRRASGVKEFFERFVKRCRR